MHTLFWTKEIKPLLLKPVVEFLGSKTTEDGDCSHEVKRRLLLGRKAPTNPDSILKSRDITLLMKVGIVKAMVFPVIMYGCESWTIKKAKHWRIDAFELWCWRRQTLESPLNCKEIKPINSKGNQSWISSGRTDAKAEAPILCPPYANNWLTGKDPDAGKRLKAGGEGDDRGRDGWMASPTKWTRVWASSMLVMDGEAWRAAVHGVANSQKWLCDWTELIIRWEISQWEGLSNDRYEGNSRKEH